ncbi:MAG TPA: ExbD/TolR family protein, partial [Geminicoccaceae bacterium]|nr:ExbD/TolR family protein [Geminicoccaceae bacterium]
MAIGAAETAGRRGPRQRRRPMAEINVTPFVDVMLVLLIVFMVTAPLLTVGVTVDLPETASSPLPGQDEPLSVSVSREGNIYLQDSQIDLADLGPRLLAITERRPDARIFVRGDKGIDSGRVMQVVGAIHAA